VFQKPVGLDVPIVAVAGAGTALVMGGEIVGIVGTTGAEIVPTVGATLSVGTAGAELTPRLLISVDPNAMPVRATPPGVVGDVEADDEAMLLEPEPHIPDDPAVPSISEVVDIPDDVDAPIAVVLDIAPVAGVAVPTPIPPPSKLELDPNISDEEVPVVEHVVPLLCIGIVPVTPVGAGLTPGEAISVAPNGIPVGEVVEPDVMPSGEVAPIVGVGATICAIATLQAKSAGSAAAINKDPVCAVHLKSAPRREAVDDPE
jgi:hypothetical protein